MRVEEPDFAAAHGLEMTLFVASVAFVLLELACRHVMVLAAAIALAGACACTVLLLTSPTAPIADTTLPSLAAHWPWLLRVSIAGVT